jgi:hypothetical protein
MQAMPQNKDIVLVAELIEFASSSTLLSESECTLIGITIAYITGNTIAYITSKFQWSNHSLEYHISSFLLNHINMNPNT